MFSVLLNISCVLKKNVYSAVFWLFRCDSKSGSSYSILTKKGKSVIFLKLLRYSSHFIKIRVLSAWFIAFYYIHKVVYQSPLPNSSIFSPSKRESPYQLSVNPFPLCQLLAVTTSAFWSL